jgi:hypothetical protein
MELATTRHVLFPSDGYIPICPKLIFDDNKHHKNTNKQHLTESYTTTHTGHLHPQTSTPSPTLL